MTPEEALCVNMLFISEQASTIILALVAALFLFCLLLRRLSRLEASLERLRASVEKQLSTRGPAPDESAGERAPAPIQPAAPPAARPDASDRDDGLRPGELVTLQRLVEESVGRSLGGLVERIDRLSDQLDGATAPHAGQRLAETIRQRLAVEGYVDVEVLEDLTARRLDEGAAAEIRVAVSAVKGGIPSKGYAVVRGDYVTRVIMRPCYEVFP
ncbi:MAG: hypothetical protein AB1486_31905 [Planctomycetota bacterium]